MAGTNCTAERAITSSVTAQHAPVTGCQSLSIEQIIQFIHIQYNVRLHHLQSSNISVSENMLLRK